VARLTLTNNVALAEGNKRCAERLGYVEKPR
jgi:hypothetical protein